MKAKSSRLSRGPAAFISSAAPFLGAALRARRRLGCALLIAGAILTGASATLAQDSPSLRFGLGAQLRATYSSELTDEGESEVELRRLRPSLRGSLADESVTFALQLNTVPGAFELVDLWVELHPFENMGIRLGQMKVPFTQYRQSSFTQLLLTDWSRSTYYFGAERQLGVLFSNSAPNPGFDYSLGVFTGSNRRASHDVGLATVYGQLVANPSSATQGTGATEELHPELIGALTFRKNGLDTRSLGDAEGGPLRTLLRLSASWDFDPKPGRDHQARLSPEVWLKYQHLSLIGVGYGSIVRSSGTGRTGRGLLGGTVEAALHTSKAHQFSARYSYTHVSDFVSSDARAHADALLAAAAPAEGSSLADQYASVGQLRSDRELALGFNYFLVGTSLEWQTEASWIHRAQQSRGNDELGMRTQLQLAF